MGVDLARLTHSKTRCAQCGHDHSLAMALGMQFLPGFKCICGAVLRRTLGIWWWDYD